MSKKKDTSSGGKSIKGKSHIANRGKKGGFSNDSRIDSKVPTIKVKTPMPQVKPPKGSGRGSSEKS